MCLISKVMIFSCLCCLILIHKHTFLVYTATTLFKMLLKYRPEDKAAKKERLLAEAKAKAEGKPFESKSKPIVVKYGLNHITYLIEQVIHSLHYAFLFFHCTTRCSIPYLNCSNMIFSAEQGTIGCNCPWCGPDRACCLAPSLVQENGNPILYCQGKSTIGFGK